MSLLCSTISEMGFFKIMDKVVNKESPSAPDTFSKEFREFISIWLVSCHLALCLLFLFLIFIWNLDPIFFSSPHLFDFKKRIFSRFLVLVLSCWFVSFFILCYLLWLVWKKILLNANVLVCWRPIPSSKRQMVLLGWRSSYVLCIHLFEFSFFSPLILVHSD